MRCHVYDYGLLCYITLRPLCRVPYKDELLLGDTEKLKVRMANMIAVNTACLIRLALLYRPTTVVAIEQPKGSWMFKQSIFQQLIKDYSLLIILTYLGLYGLDLLKGTHICTNSTNLGRSWKSFWFWGMFSNHIIWTCLILCTDFHRAFSMFFNVFIVPHLPGEGC